MATIKEKDFIEIEYVGKLKEDGSIFDATDEKVAKDNEIYNPDMNYGPVVICVGEGHVIKGLDNFLVGKDTGEYKVEIKPEEGFGKKNPKLLKLMPTNIFLKQQIQPMPGLQVTLDGIMGTIRSVTGGRTLVDFNHPLSGRMLVYDVKVLRNVEDDKEKLYSFMSLQFGKKHLEVDLNEGKATVKVRIEVPKKMKEALSEKVRELIPTITEISFEKKEAEKKKEKKEEKEETKAEPENKAE